MGESIRATPKTAPSKIAPTLLTSNCASIYRACRACYCQLSVSYWTLIVALLTPLYHVCHVANNRSRYKLQGLCAKSLVSLLAPRSDGPTRRAPVACLPQEGRAAVLCWWGCLGQPLSNEGGSLPDMLSFTAFAGVLAAVTCFRCIVRLQSK
jgi:hypothetical protein